MFRIREKSFIGLLFGCFLIIVMIWISFKFDLSPQQTGLITFISLIIIGGPLPMLIEYILDEVSNEDKKRKKFYDEIKNTSDPERKKEIIKKWSYKIQFKLSEFRDLISYQEIKDDEFWISFFLHQTKEISRYQLDYFYGFLHRLESEESIKKLKEIVISRKLLEHQNEDLESRIKFEIRLRRSRR
jgi:hypothetical protein